MDNTKEKGSQHDPKHMADKEETLMGGGSQNAKQRFITMAEVATIAKSQKEPDLRELLMGKRKKKEVPTLELSGTPQCVRI